MFGRCGSRLRPFDRRISGESLEGKGSDEGLGVPGHDYMDFSLRFYQFADQLSGFIGSDSPCNPEDDFSTFEHHKRFWDRLSINEMVIP